MTLTRVIFSGLLSVALSASAQTYTAQHIQFSQLGSFTQQQLEDAAGIHTGTSFTKADLAAAAQRLVDTGYFDDMGASLEGKFSAITVTFEDKPTEKSHLLPVSFANFVWLTPEEIDRAIKAKVPLFIGYLPENNPAQDEIKTALTQALAAKSVAADVVYETYEPTLRHPRREIDFHILKPTIRISNVKLAGVTSALVPLVQKSVSATANTPYTQGPAEQTSFDRILAPLLDAGYIEASMTDVSLLPTVAPNGDVAVVLTATLNPGEIYRVSDLRFAGTPILAAEALTPTMKLHAGDVASHAALLETLAPLDSAYRRQGYMDVVIHAIPKADQATHRVSYDITVEPGEQYRVHEVIVNNLDPAARADFDRGFRMKTGELYNPEYLTGFLKANTALQALSGYSASFKASADPNTHTVDVFVNFFRMTR